MNIEQTMDYWETHNRGKLKVLRVAVNHREERKQLNNYLHLKSILARTTIYDPAYREKISTASTGNPVGVTEPSSNFFVNFFLTFIFYISSS